MTITLNIGLNIGNTLALTLSQAVQACERAGLSVASVTRLQSDSEATAVVVLADGALPSLTGALFHLSVVLAQDCIGAWDGLTGALVGPDAAAWGAFNPEYFFLPSGQRLGPVALPAAA